MLVRCKCPHVGQDQLNGPGVRVANELKRTDGPQQLRCTVCGAIHQLASVEPSPAKKAKK